MVKIKNNNLNETPYSLISNNYTIKFPTIHKTTWQKYELATKEHH
jgi:hypothetical protein